MLLLLLALGSAAAFTRVEIDNNDLALRYNLPRESTPTFYDVRLFLDPDSPGNFSGIVTIRIVPERDTQEIVLHALELDINQIEIINGTSSNNLVAGFELASDDTQLLRINTTQLLFASQVYTVNIDYVGYYAENQYGIFVSNYQVANASRNLIASRFHPTFARRVFPCYDEPNIKAIFRTTVYASAAYPVVLNNMPLRNDSLKPIIAGWVKHEFEDTPPMSTYSLAILVSDLNYNNNSNSSNSSTSSSIYFRPGIQNRVQFALDFGQRMLYALENYTEFPYQLRKLDKVVLPEFSSDALGSWGLAFYREAAISGREDITPAWHQQNSICLISQESARMWFDNELGLWSWGHNWLNEGLSSFVGNFAADIIYPEWHIMDQYVTAMQGLFQSDAAPNSNALSQLAVSPSQILNTLNREAQRKSGSIIRMLQHILTPEVFQQGLINYFNSNNRSSTRPEDLYGALQSALVQSNLTINWPLSTIMATWTNQAGFPVITATRDALTANSVTITQQRFLNQPANQTSERWYIPVNWAISGNPDFSDTKPQNWVPISLTAHSVDIPGLANSSWFIINKKQTGYYRVNYDDANWQELARALKSSHEVIHVLNRAQIIDDSFNLARNGQLDYLNALEISRYLVAEADYVPWAAANSAFEFLNLALAETNVYDHWQKYLLELSAPLFKSLGFERQSSEAHVTASHRRIILDINCRLGNQDCVNQSEALFRNWTTFDVGVHPEIQPTVLCTNLRQGSEQDFHFLWQQYLKSDEPSEQTVFLDALGCTSNNETRAFYLHQAIINSTVREQDRHMFVVSIINGNPEGVEDALDFIIENFHLLQSRVQSGGTVNILNALSKRLTAERHAQKIQEMQQKHAGILTVDELAAIENIRENIASAILWRNNRYNQIASWLQEDDKDGTTKIASSILLVVTVCIMLLNY